MKRCVDMPLRFAALLLAGFLAGSFIATTSGCAKPNLYGPGRFHDMSRVKMGMSQSEGRDIMGAGYKSVWEEGLGGQDMGIYIWQYPDGRNHFNTDGVIKIEPY